MNEINKDELLDLKNGSAFSLWSYMAQLLIL